VQHGALVQSAEGLMPSFRFVHDYINPLEAYVVVVVFAMVLTLLAHRLLRYSFGRSFLLALPSALVLYLAIAICADASIANYPRRPFDTADWLSSPDKRYELVDDLLAKDVLVGVSPGEILRLLGPPDINSMEGKSLSYRIGYTPGFSFVNFGDATLDVLRVHVQDEKVSGVELLLGS
jgi:hypothetical protein